MAKSKKSKDFPGCEIEKISHTVTLFIPLNNKAKASLTNPTPNLNVKETWLGLFEAGGKVYNDHVDWIFARKLHNLALPKGSARSKYKSFSKNAIHENLYAKLTKKYSEVPVAILQGLRDVALGEL